MVLAADSRTASEIDPESLPTHDRRLTSVLPTKQSTRQAAVQYFPSKLASRWCWSGGVASEALRDIITGFLNQVRFD